MLSMVELSTCWGLKIRGNTAPNLTHPFDSFWWICFQAGWGAHGRGSSHVALVFWAGVLLFVRLVLMLCQEAFSCYSCILSWFFPDYRKAAMHKRRQNVSMYVKKTACGKKKMQVRRRNTKVHWAFILFSETEATRGKKPVKYLAELPTLQKRKKSKI